ncbi:MAG: sulfatase-like hydrolase/transferase [Myxococcota bacterium]
MSTFILFFIACTQSTPPDVLLITLDTTRADALGSYGRTPSPTPHLDQLASRGTRFSHVATTVPLTLPAHASLLTGQTPDHHSVRDNNGAGLSDDARTLAEHLSQRGYATGAFVSAIVLDAIFGLDQGFDIYDDRFDLSAATVPGDAVLAHPGQAVAERALDWVKQADPQRPLFTWLHLYEPHAPYRPPEPFDGDVYLGEVHYADAIIGALMKKWPRATPPLIVFTADHGEGRGEHGEMTHGVFVYRSTMHIPLIIAGPGVPEGVVVDDVASIVDIAPTVLDLLGLPPLSPSDGLSLLPAIHGHPSEASRLVYGESYHGRFQYGLAPLRFVEGDGDRFIDAPRPELYDLRMDPGEQNNIVEGADLARFHRALSERSVPTEPDLADPDVRAALTALGYLAGPSMVVGEDVLPDPKDHPGIVSIFEQLIIDARTRPPAEAVPLLEAFVQEHPRMASARMLLSTALELSGDTTAALDAIQPLRQARPEETSLMIREANLRLNLGEIEAARHLAESVQHAAPDSPLSYALLAEIARRDGDCQSAERSADEALKRSPESTAALRVRGACRLDRGANDGAASDLEQVLKATPDDPDAALLLGLARARQGRMEDAIAQFEAVLLIDPKRAEATISLGKARFLQGRFEEAIPLLVPAVADPDLGGEAVMLLADARLRVGQPPQVALSLLDEAERRSPGDPRVRKIRSAVYMKMGRVEDALKEMEAAQADLPYTGSP